MWVAHFTSNDNSSQLHTGVYRYCITSNGSYIVLAVCFTSNDNNGLLHCASSNAIGHCWHYCCMQVACFTSDANSSSVFYTVQCQ